MLTGFPVVAGAKGESMIKVFRAAIALSIACFVVFSVLPLGPVRFQVDLPQHGAPESVAQLGAVIGVLALLLGTLALIVTAIASIGLLLLQRWARTWAMASSVLGIVCVAISMCLLPIPIARLLSLSHFLLLAVCLLSWMAVLWMLRAPELRARFGA